MQEEKDDDLPIDQRANNLEKLLNVLLDDGHLSILMDFLDGEGENNKNVNKLNSGFTKKMTGMFNSIKDALPSFEDDPQHGNIKSFFQYIIKYDADQFFMEK